MSLGYESGDKSLFLLQIAALATLVAGDPRPADREGFFKALLRSRFFHRVMEDPTSAIAVFDELGWFSEGVGHSALAENLIHVLRQRAAFAADPELPDRLAAETDAATLLAMLRDRLFGEESALEAHWMVREMVRAALWTEEGIRGGAAVPTRKVREAAWRLGLLDMLHVDDADQLLAASKAVTAHLGPLEGFDEPLALFAARHGCTWGCPHTATCAFHCREKHQPGGQ